MQDVTYRPEVVSEARRHGGRSLPVAAPEAGHAQAERFMRSCEMVHYGLAETVRDQRNQVLQTAYAAHPERFVRGVPMVPNIPREVWINKPREEVSAAAIAQ